MAGFDASASALGFLHQLRWAFLELLRSAKTDQSVRVNLETIDDVAVLDAGGKPLKAVQLKHRDPQFVLTDSNPDLWKTLRVWLETPGLRGADGPQLFLVTTGMTSPGSIAEMLGMELPLRDPLAARQALDKVAETSVDKATNKARETWQQAEASVRLELLSRVTVVSESAPIGQIDDLLAQELQLTVRPEHMPLYIERLWGWWDSRCVAMLLSKDPTAATAAFEVYSKLQEIRDDFTRDSLPLDPAFENPSDDELLEHSDKLFVKQLQWIDIHGDNLKYAMNDYHRAYSQTAAWLRDADLFDEDIERYQRRLLEEWRINFEDICDDLHAQGDDSEVSKKNAGKQLFRLLRNSNEIHIRKNFTEAFYAKGSRQIIADRGELGWHPDFEARVRELLLEKTPA